MLDRELLSCFRGHLHVTVKWDRRLPLKITSHPAPGVGTSCRLPPGTVPALAGFSLWLCHSTGLLQGRASRTKGLGVAWALLRAARPWAWRA